MGTLDGESPAGERETLVTKISTGLFFLKLSRSPIIHLGVWPTWWEAIFRAQDNGVFSVHSDQVVGLT